MSRQQQIDYENFLKACGKWQRIDNVLAITFKAPYTYMPRYIEEAVCEINGYEYHPNREQREIPYGFYAEATELVENRDDRVRDKILAYARQEERNRETTKRQLEFEFEELED